MGNLRRWQDPDNHAARHYLMGKEDAPFLNTFLAWRMGEGEECKLNITVSKRLALLRCRRILRLVSSQLAGMNFLAQI